MHIKELEFIRDFYGFLQAQESSLKVILSSIEEGEEDEKTKEIQHIHVHWLKSVCLNIELMNKSFGDFKEEVDVKYFEVWKKKHPQMIKQ